MIRIRRISNPYLEVNLRTIEKVKEIIRKQFPLLAAKKEEEIDSQLVDSLSHEYQTALFVAENTYDSVTGFALLLYMPDLDFCFLDYVAVTPGKISSGVGGALYERVRDEANALGASGIFFECLPDDPDLCNNPDDLKQNQKRLAFYERFGARPIANTRYEAKVKPDDDCPPYLVFDGLGIRDTLEKEQVRKIMQAILERKYEDYCDADYVKMVVESVTDNPVVMRAPKYRKRKSLEPAPVLLKEKNKILFISNDRHSIHHIRERGYVESPVRVKYIQKELDKTGLFRYETAIEYPDRLILEIHDKHYFEYFRNVCRELPAGKSVYPYVFPIRNAVKAPKDLSIRAGYYCFDTFTPINQNAFLAARWGVNCVLTATDKIIEGTRAAYVLTRPPGHHAERSVFGGFCYFNNCAIAAQRFSKTGTVAILDIDFHHGNGQQQIFYNRKDVFTISIHGHPSFAYPYFSGFSDECGEDAGLGFNENYPLPEVTSYEKYSLVLGKALRKIQGFRPDYLIIALGLDTAKNDPTGTWEFTPENFRNSGKMIGNLKLPTLIVQEGGYKSQSLGTIARAFFEGFHEKRFAN
ncbi:MAG: histone deacetylase family protein [Bacteroidetes bacterium]|nr:histone deacetylase family protein [Bacteroidota bacterium]MBU1719164.1 histone deacetylase family protein [Bacteroidota bacterium]